jgi:hypothetical protein
MSSRPRYHCPTCGQELMAPPDSSGPPVQEETAPLRWVQYHTLERCEARRMAVPHRSKTAG